MEPPIWNLSTYTKFNYAGTFHYAERMAKVHHDHSIFLNIKAPSVLHEDAAIVCFNVLDNPSDIRLWLGHRTSNDTICRLLICAIISERPKHLEDDILPVLKQR